MLVRGSFLSTLLLTAMVGSFIGCSTQEPSVEKKRAAAVPAKTVVRTALEAKSLDGTVKGRVLYDGEAPKPALVARIETHGDRVGCLEGSTTETHEQTWMVDPQSRGVANVVVWLETPDDKYFSLTEQDKNRAGQVVVIDQPHCAFMPHVIAVYPSYFDGAKQVKTGQVLEIRNSARFPHAIQWDPSRENDAVSENMPPGGKKVMTLNYQKRPLYVGCGIHHWMRAIIWFFDHPYHAITKEDGVFEFRNVPTGVPLTLHAWHETKAGSFDKRTITLQSGENPDLELRISK
jgi:hypothetical protein